MNKETIVLAEGIARRIVGRPPMTARRPRIVLVTSERGLKLRDYELAET